MRPLLTGIGLAVVAMATAGTVEASDYCREYQRRVTIGGKVQDSYGTACMQPDGSWQTVSEGNPQVVGSVQPAYAPAPVYVQPEPIVYYEEPLYVQRQVRYDPAPLFWGLNLSFNDRDHWRGHRGYHRDNHWHDRGRDRGRGHGHHNGGHGGHGGRGRD